MLKLETLKLTFPMTYLIVGRHCSHHQYDFKNFVLHLAFAYYALSLTQVEPSSVFQFGFAAPISVHVDITAWRNLPNFWERLRKFWNVSARNTGTHWWNFGSQTNLFAKPKATIISPVGCPLGSTAFRLLLAIFHG